MIKRSGSAQWKGTLKEGRGTVSTGSGVLEHQPYGFNTRFQHGKGTNPEELIGAAHASCFSMALSKILGESKWNVAEIDTKATVSLEEQAGGFAITEVHLDVKATVPGASNDDFKAAAEKAKAGCPVSKLLNAKITMDAALTD